jgi:hypothetical protein
MVIEKIRILPISIAQLIKIQRNASANFLKNKKNYFAEASRDPALSMLCITDHMPSNLKKIEK